MKLTYRGVSYDYTPSSAPELGPVYARGTYRGAAVSFHALAEMPEQPGHDLMWRGVPYCSGTQVQMAKPTVQSAATGTASGASSTPEPETATPTLSVLERARALFIRNAQRMRRREQAMLTRLDEEVGLTAEDAAHYESRIQGKMPHDFAGYSRSHTAMS
ncbi:MAG: DUF4278 domain-containing protein [Cyanothece sp. SIO1E1]|nr:DUF4278 domain-containing protein [Cyanothece sp. SIO1E1]